MITLFSRLFLKTDGKSPAQLRTAYGTLAGIVGIFLNLLLFAGKFLAGVLSSSVAITADAFNNLSDAGSSVVTLLGFQLAGKKPDPDHPFGHGRMEYLSGLAVSLLILLMGVELVKSSVDKILHPAPVDSGWLVSLILCASIAVKLYMAWYNRALGKKLNSAAMLATSADSLSDSVATLAVLIATLVSQAFGLMIDGWCGILVSLFIFKAGIEAARETIDPLLGAPPSKELVERISTLVLSHDIVVGIHDLIVHDYGPGRMMISLHAEVSSAGDILSIHDEIDNIERQLQKELGCHAVIHMDPVVTDDSQVTDTKRTIAQLVCTVDPSLTIHDFRMVSGPTHTNVIFDVVAPYDLPLTDAALTAQIQQEVRQLEGNYFAVVTVDKNFT
jgi:cation diffusion facilitator family transporter